MADQTKIYYPETIPDTPFPQEGQDNLATSTPSSGDVISPTTIADKPMPKKVIARELISNSLNTLSRKILGIYEFTKMGAIQIGEFIAGISGEIKISPDGIVAKNKSGNTTFALDGDTGDATFRGIVQASDFVVADENGLVSINNFDFGSVLIDDFRVLTPGNTTWNDLPGSQQSFTLTRDVRALMLLSVIGLPDAGTVFMRIIATGLDMSHYSYLTIKDDGSTQTIHNMLNLSSGDITVKVQYQCNSPATQIQVNNLTFSYLILGR